MSAHSEPSRFEFGCLVHFVCVPSADNQDVDFEEYQCKRYFHAPSVGDVHEWRDLRWNITAVYPYADEDQAMFYVAVCSQGSVLPVRQDWDDTAPLLYIPVMLGGDPAQNEDGSSHFGTCDRHEDIPTRHIFEDWEFSDFQRFKPIGAHAPQEFKEIVLCWCVKQPELVAA